MMSGRQRRAFVLLGYISLCLLGCEDDGSHPDCGVEDTGVAVAPEPFDSLCHPVSDDERLGEGELPLMIPLRLVIHDNVAHADFRWLGRLLVRFRIGLDDGVIALTDYAAVNSEIRELGEWEMCRAMQDEDLEVRLFARGTPDVPRTEPLAGPIVRVVRHTTGGSVFTFGGALSNDPTDWLRRGAIFLAPERAMDARCCADADGACVVDVCGTTEPVIAGCTWADEISPDDGFCHARQIR